MKKIYIADMTLGGACKSLPQTPGFKEKLEIARQLDKAGVDVMELAAIENSKTDSLLIRTIASFVKTAAVSVAVGNSEAGAEEAYAAVSGAAHPRLSVQLPVSPALMEYSCHLKPDAVLASIKTLIAKCASLTPDVEFCAIDATRAEAPFLKSAIEAAVGSGATVVTICDNEGSRLPAETEKFVSGLIASVPALSKVRLGYSCENTYGLGLSSLITAALCGAQEVKIAVGSGIHTALDKFAEIMRSRGESIGFSTALRQTELGRIAKQIYMIAAEKRSDVASLGNFDGSAQDGPALTKADDIKAVAKAVKKLGYELSDEDKNKVYDAFRVLADKKNRITTKELEAIIAGVALEVPPTYKLISYVINSGNLVTASASIALEAGGETKQGISLGDGPVDAAFLAIEQITGCHYELDDFQIRSVTEGREAMGSAVVKLRSNGKLYSGQGLSTDIVGASIRAYVSAVNKIKYEDSVSSNH